MPPTMELEAHLKNQQIIICQLKSKLKDAICKLQLLYSELEGKDKCINELEKW